MKLFVKVPPGGLGGLFTGGAVFRDVADVDAVREQRRVVVDVLQVDLNVGVTDQTLATFVLGEDGETPLRATVGLVAIQRLSNANLCKLPIPSAPLVLNN